MSSRLLFGATLLLCVLAAPLRSALADRPWLGPDHHRLSTLQERALVSLYEFGQADSGELAIMRLEAPRGGNFEIGEAGTIDCRVPLNTGVAGTVQVHPSGRRAYVGTDQGIAIISISGSQLGTGEPCSCTSGDLCFGLERMHTQDTPHPYSLRLSPDGQYLMAFGTAVAELGRIGDHEGAAMIDAGGQTQGFIFSTQAVGGRPVRPCPPAQSCEEEERLANSGVCLPDPTCLENRATSGNTRRPLEARRSFELNLLDTDAQELVMDSAFSPDGRRFYVLTSIPYAQVFTRCYIDGRNPEDPECPGSVASGKDIAHLGIYDAEATAAGSFGLPSPRQFRKIAQVDLGMRVPIPAGHERPLITVTEKGERGWRPETYHRTTTRCIGRAPCANNALAHFDGAESLQVGPDGQYLYIASHGLTRRVNGLNVYDRDLRLSGGVGVLDLTQIEHAIADAYEATDPSATNTAQSPEPPRIEAADVLVDFISKEVPGAERNRSSLFVADAWITGLPLLVPLCATTLLLGVGGACGWALIGTAISGILAIIDWSRILPFHFQPVRVTGVASVGVTPDGDSLYIGARNTDNFALVGERLRNLSDNDPGATGRNWSLDWGEMHAWTTFYEHFIFVQFWNFFLQVLNPGLLFQTAPRTLSAMVRNNIEREPKWRRRFYRALKPEHQGIDDSRFEEVVGSDQSNVHHHRWVNREDLSAEASWGRFQKHRNEQLGYGKATRFAFTRDWAVIYTHGDLPDVRKLRVARRSALEALGTGAAPQVWDDTDPGVVAWNPQRHPVDEVVAGGIVLTAPDVLASTAQTPVKFSDSERCTNCGTPNGDQNQKVRVGWVATLPETDRDDDGVSDMVEAYNSYYWLSDEDSAEDARPQSDGPIPGLKARSNDESVLARWVSEPFAGETLYPWEARVFRRAAPTEANFWGALDGGIDARVHGGGGVEYGERLDCWAGQSDESSPGRAVHYIGGPGCDDAYDGVDADFVDGAFSRLSQLDGDSAPMRVAEANRDSPMIPLGMFLPTRGLGYHHPARGDTYLTDSFGTVRLVRALTRIAGRWALRHPEGPPMVFEDLSRIGGGQFVAQRARQLGSRRVMLPAMHHTHFMGVEAEVSYLVTPRGGCGDADPCASGFTGAGGDEETFEVGRHPASRWHPLNGELIAWLSAEDFIERVNVNRAVLALIAPDGDAQQAQSVGSVFANLGPTDADPSKIVAHRRGYTQAMSVVVERPTELMLDSLDVTVHRSDAGEPQDFSIDGAVSGSHCAGGTARVTITLQKNGRALRDNGNRVVTLEVDAELDDDCAGTFTLASLRDEVMNEFTFDSFDDAVSTGEPPVVGVFLERDGPSRGPSQIGEAFASSADAASFALERFELSEGDPGDRTDDGALNGRVVWAATHRVQVLDPLGLPLENAPLQFFTPDERPELRLTTPDCPAGGGPGCCAAGSCFTDENGYAWVTSLNDLKPRAALDQVMHSVSLLSASSQAQLGLTMQALAAADIPIPDDHAQEECKKLRFNPVDQFVQSVTGPVGDAIDGVLTNKGQTADEMGSYFWVAYRAAMEQNLANPEIQQALGQCLAASGYDAVPDAAKDPRHVANLWFTGQQIGVEGGRAAAVKDQVEDAFLLLNAPQQFASLARSIAKLALLGDRSAPARQCTEGNIGAALGGLGYCDAMTVRCNPQLASSVGREGSFLWTLDTLRQHIGQVGQDMARTMCPGLQDEQKLTCRGPSASYVLDLQPAQPETTLTWDIDVHPATATLTQQAEPLPGAAAVQPPRECTTEEGQGHENVAELILSMIFGSTDKEVNEMWDAAKGVAAQGKHGRFDSLSGPIDPQLHDGVKTWFRVGHYVGYLLGWVAAEIIVGLATAVATAGAALVIKALRGMKLLAKLADKASQIQKVVESIRSTAGALPVVKKGLKAVRMTSTFVAVFGAFENPAEGGLIELIGGSLGNVRAVEALKQNAQEALLAQTSPSGGDMAVTVAESLARMFPDSETAGDSGLANMDVGRQHQLYLEALAGARSAQELDNATGRQALRLVTELLAADSTVTPVTSTQAAGLGVQADGAAKFEQLRNAAVDEARKLELCQEINSRCD